MSRCCQLAAELPMNLVGPVIFGSVVYWLVGLNDLPGRFFTFLLILIETGFAAIGLGMVVAAAAPNAQVWRTAFWWSGSFVSVGERSLSYVAFERQ